jgi:hypothetical protein
MPSPTPIIIRSAVLSVPGGGINPHGLSTFRMQGPERELEIEVENLSFPQGTALSAIVDGVNVATLIVDDRQRARITLRTINGQQVPFVNEGSTIEV